MNDRLSSSVTMKGLLVLILVIMGTACSQEPQTIQYASDECAYCKMMITDARFSSQIVTAKGKAYKFDSIECMAMYHKAHAPEIREAKLWVSNFSAPGEWLEAGSAGFVQSEVIKSPMGKSLLALPSKELALEHMQDYPGTMLRWEQVEKNTILEKKHN